ncbi:hypothetical protein TNCT_705611, partial [Trichonephila clavata]
MENYLHLVFCSEFSISSFKSAFKGSCVKFYRFLLKEQLTINMSSIIDFVTILTLSAIVIVTANPEEKGQENLQDLAIANNEFAFNLLRKVNDSRNAFLSPFSISQVFGMLFYGARGDTAE